MQIKLSMLIFTSLLLCACASAPDVKGSWIDGRRPNPPIEKQGIYLGPEGKAASINGQNKAYKTWARKGKKLTLTGVDASNNQFTDFTENYKIKKIKDGVMTLEKEGKLLHYIKDDSANYKENR